MGHGIGGVQEVQRRSEMCLPGGLTASRKERGARIVSVTTFNIDPGCGEGLLGGKVALRLAKGIETWARTQKATHILYHVTAGIDAPRADRFFRRIGMRQLGGNYGARV